MPLSPQIRRSLLIVLPTLVVLLVLVYLLWPRTRPLPVPTSAEYQQYLRDFQVGVAALDAGRDDLARRKLERAVDLIPEEPAAWANLGLLQLRNNNLEQAAKDLRKAQELAPESGAVEALLGLLAEKQGRLPAAVAHLRKAVAQRPRDVTLLFILADAISKEGGPNSAAEYQQLLEQILHIQPNNLPVLVLRAGATLRRQDQAGFKDALAQLGRLAPNWSPLARKTLEELVKATKDEPGEVVPLLQVLDNALKVERGYSRDSFIIRPLPGVVGTPIDTFLRLQPVRSQPASPDRELTFALAPVPAPELPPGRWDSVLPLWLLNAEQRENLVKGGTAGGFAAQPQQVFNPAVLVASATTVRLTSGAGLTLPFPGGTGKVAPGVAGVLPMDWDNDLRNDLILCGAGGLAFQQQRVDGTFTAVTAKAGLPAALLAEDYHGAWAADLEADGDLDIVLARRSGPVVLLRNNRDGTFKALETFASVTAARAFTWADLDGDGMPDAAFLDAAGKVHVLANERSGQFTPWPVPPELGNCHALTMADINGDGTMDLIALRSDGAVVRLSTQDNRRGWQLGELTRWSGAADSAPGQVGVFAADLDNNGALDILVAGPMSAQVHLGAEANRFVAIQNPLPLRVTAVLDLNRDGRLDLLGLSKEGRPVQALNQSQKGYRWQSLWPLANPRAGDNRINSFAVGGEIEVRSGPLVQRQPITGPGVHFGLGQQTGVEAARIVWPNGVPQWEFALPSDRLITAAQRLTGSCPFLFTHDGKGVRFAGDFLWASPLGMYVNAQNIGPVGQTTEWLKIPGEFLTARDGQYDVRVQANLWEVYFFDQMELLVVDHPPDTELHVDERFWQKPSPPRFHITTPARPVARVLDHRGQDATELVRARDGRYLDRATRGRFQGVMEEHWVEVDLGDEAPKQGPLLLVAHGWVHPTNSSINFALTQGNHEPPRSLVLEIPDGKGGWKVGRPALGFPAGKNKTMLIRLDGIEGEGVSRRFRLRTNMEVFWDYLGYARDLAQVEGRVPRERLSLPGEEAATEADPLGLASSSYARVHRPPTLAADLRFRGIVEMTQKDASSPELPDYDKVISTGQPWRDMTGYYTRFGDVRVLLARVDDRYVIMNAGDEIGLRFLAPAAPLAGWKRDFIWECDGWARDADLNTRFGNSILPLPAHGQTEQPPGRLEDDPVYRRFPQDWRVYHTRHVTDHLFRRGLRR